MAFGFGGLGASFPMRFGAPLSNQVMSDAEYQNDWNNRLAAVPQTIGGGDGGLAAFGSMYQAAINPNDGRPRVTNKAAVGDFMDTTRQSLTGGLANRTTDGINSSQYSRLIDSLGLRGAYNNLSAPAAESVNPEWTRLNAEMQAALQARTQNQTAQQQAYNGMLGDGQLNGVLGANYSNPGFGQVNGQSGNPFGSPSNPGVDMSWSSGVYNPSGNTQTGVYNPAANSYKQWGL